MNNELKELVEKAKTEFTNVEVTVDPSLNSVKDQKYSALANGTLVSGDTTHLLFERIKNIIGEREVAASRRQ